MPPSAPASRQLFRQARDAHRVALAPWPSLHQEGQVRIGPKRTVVTLERGGKARMFHVQHATKDNVREVLVRNADRASILYRDESNLYTRTGEEYARHGRVKHTAGEYVRYEDGTVKRGMHGVYQRCGEAYLHRYLAEFDFRYNRRTALGWTDNMRIEVIMKSVGGKRLTYRRTHEAAYA